MVFQNRFYFLDISCSCRDIAVDVIAVSMDGSDNGQITPNQPTSLSTYTTISQQPDEISRKLNWF